MRSIVPLLLLVLLASCSSARYATGPDSERIRAMEGFRGRIEAVEYPTVEKNLSRRRMVVYLPASYATDSLRRYPVLYLLHGARGNELTWQERGQVFACLDSLVAVGEAAEFILVLPNLNNYFGDKDYKNGRAVNATRAFWTVDGEAESHFVDEVVALTDSLFRTLPGKADRALAGMSSGGLQSVYISANHPEKFGSVALFSPYFYPTVAALGHRDFYGGLWKKLAVQFADLPAVDYAIFIGRHDIFYPHVRNIDRKMTKKGYPHRLVVTGGGHKWTSWQLFFRDYAASVFQ